MGDGFLFFWGVDFSKISIFGRYGSQNHIFWTRWAKSMFSRKSAFRIFWVVGFFFWKKISVVLIFTKKKFFQKKNSTPQNIRKLYFQIWPVAGAGTYEIPDWSLPNSDLTDFQNFRNIDFLKFLGGQKKILKKFSCSKN